MKKNAFPMSSRRVPRIGISGPVGCGKTMLIEQVVPLLSFDGYKVGIISNDVISKEDAERMRKNLATEKGLMSEDLVIGVATGGCPHTAIREDPSMNISIVEEMESKHDYLDLIPFPQLWIYSLKDLLEWQCVDIHLSQLQLQDLMTLDPFPSQDSSSSVQHLLLR